MTKTQQLEAALRWALENGVRWSSVCKEFNDSGCGCCSGTIEPPEELRAVILNATRDGAGKEGGQ